MDRSGKAEALGDRGKVGAVVRMDHGLDVRNPWMRAEGLQRMAQDRLAAQVTVLFGSLARHTPSASGSDHECNGIAHAISPVQTPRYGSGCTLVVRPCVAKVMAIREKVTGAAAWLMMRPIVGGSISLGLAALLTLLPAAVLPPRRGGNGGGLFWALLVVAALGPIAFEIAAQGGIWRTGFSATLWTIIASTMLVYLLACLASPTARGLRVFLLPYLVALGVIALLWSAAPEHELPASAMTAWLQVHIGVSLVTYALITLAAASAVAVWVKERALRKYKAPGWIDAIPSVADSERVQNLLLLMAEIVLGLGLATGITANFYRAGALVPLDHKTILSLATFVVVGILLSLQRGRGLRGRQAARLVLAAYLLITLAFPGVKFVTDVILTQP
jgi:ABC-type uncharacterized transport system permease subunit